MKVDGRFVPEGQLKRFADQFLKENGFDPSGRPVGEVDEIQDAFEHELEVIREVGQPITDRQLHKAVENAKFEVAIG